MVAQARTTYSGRVLPATLPCGARTFLYTRLRRKTTRRFVPARSGCLASFAFYFTVQTANRSLQTRGYKPGGTLHPFPRPIPVSARKEKDYSVTRGRIQSGLKEGSMLMRRRLYFVLPDIQCARAMLDDNQRACEYGSWLIA